MNQELLQYLWCPECKSNFSEQCGFLICKKCNKKYEVIDDNIIEFFDNVTPDLELSIQKWDKFYQKRLEDKSYLKDYKDYLENFFEDTYRQLNEYKKFDRDLVYLEIGCGPMILGQQIASRCQLVIGIDFCPSALKIAKKMLEAKGVKNYLLVQGDILNMPIKTGLVDLIYGGGVIEHFKNTQQCVNELYRVLKKDGISFNTVPYLNIGSLTYRQIWGNIPNFPILKQLAEFVHIKLLRSKHMIFGYELSFLGSTLKKIHKKAGFLKIYVDKFDAKLAFDFIPTKFLKKLCIKIANSSRFFWPMIRIVAEK